MNTNVKELDNHQIADALEQWFQEAERELNIPYEWICTFGKWHQLKSFMESILWEYEQVCETVDESDKDRQIAESALQDIKNGISEALDVLEDIPDENNYALTDAIKTLSKLI